MFKISVEPRAPLTHGDFHGAGESNHELNSELIDFHLNMACRDGIFNNDTVSKQYSSMVAGPIWSRFGPIFLVRNFHIFGLCSRPFIFNFLLYSTTVLYEDSDSERENF